MERKRCRQNRLRRDLDGSRQLLGLFHDLLGAERLGCDEVRECKAVKKHREANASHAVGNRANPGKLGLVDGEVRRGGATETLRVENVQAVVGRQRFSLDRSTSLVYSVA